MMTKEKLYPMYCAWCKGKLTVCGESEVEHSSGICVDCFREFFKNIYTKKYKGI